MKANVFGKFLLSFATVALAVASAGSTHRVKLFQPSWIGDTQLKPGEYKVEVIGDKAVIKGMNESVQATVKVEKNDSKFSSTSVRYLNGDGKYRVQEIRVGGTDTRIVFSGAGQPAF